MAYLDKNGVSKLWAKVKALFNKGVTDISINGKTVTMKVAWLLNSIQMVLQQLESYKVLQ